MGTLVTSRFLITLLITLLLPIIDVTTKEEMPDVTQGLVHSGIFYSCLFFDSISMVAAGNNRYEYSK
ncbi:hypothetical protein QGP82_24515 [Leptothoe sp. LEGE 181152]|nr:hypothetical protein [Leptothoe sp. LEGE 181152]